MKFIADAKELTRVIKACAVACNDNNCKQALKCIELTVRGGDLVVTALDGFVMIQHFLKVKGAEDGTCAVKPKWLLNVLGKARDDVLIQLDEKNLLIAQGEFRTYIPVFDGDYIRHDEIWPNPEREKTKIMVNPRYLAEVAKTFVSDFNSIVMEIPHDVNAPILITQGDDRALVLPIRINKQGA